MNGPELVAAVADRLESTVPDWPVYRHGLPDGPLPGRYLVVRASEGWEEATRSCGRTNVQTPRLWVAASARHADERFASSQAAEGAAAIRAGLRGWRPEGRWSLRPDGSSPPSRNEALPDTTATAVEQFALRSTI